MPLGLPPRGICILFIYAASSFFGKKFFAKAIPFCFILSANFGLYKEQKIVYSKIRAEFINRYTD